MTAALIPSLVVTAVGAGISAYGQIQAGKTQAAIANYNAAQQEQQARISLATMQAQAAMQRRMAEAQFAMRSAEANAKFQNAIAIENQALGQDAINRANLRKRQEDFARMQGEQRASIAASGIVESSGTPLDLLAETAGRIQQEQEQKHYEGELNRRTLFREADLERLGGSLALAGATIDRGSALAEAGLRDATARASYRAGMGQAEITRLTGAAAKQAAGYGAVATIFGGATRMFDVSSTFKTS